MNFKKVLFLISLTSLPLWAKANNKSVKEQPKQEIKDESQVDVKKLSIAIGHLISKTINDIGVSFDMDLIIQGLKDASLGLPSPLSENECMSAINQEQKKLFDSLAQKNLKEAESFLSKESLNTEMTLLQEGKILYKVLKQGNGETVKDSGKVAIRYKGSLLNGEVFGESNQDETIDVSQLVSGLKHAMVGMKEGEKRLIHIHPEQGYGTDGMLPPNSLLSFEIEIAKAHIEEAEQNLADSTKQDLETDSQIR